MSVRWAICTLLMDAAVWGQIIAPKRQQTPLTRLEHPSSAQWAIENDDYYTAAVLQSVPVESEKNSTAIKDILQVHYSTRTRRCEFTLLI